MLENLTWTTRKSDFSWFSLKIPYYLKISSKTYSVRTWHSPEFIFPTMIIPNPTQVVATTELIPTLRSGDVSPQTNVLVRGHVIHLQSKFNVADVVCLIPTSLVVFFFFFLAPENKPITFLTGCEFYKLTSGPWSYCTIRPLSLSQKSRDVVGLDSNFKQVAVGNSLTVYSVWT